MKPDFTPIEATATGAAAARPAPGSRAGGLRRVAKGEMTPVFTMLIVMTFLDVLVMLVLPYLLTRHTESQWQNPLRLGFVGLSILAGISFGLFTSLYAERRNHSPLWFLLGHLGTFAAPLPFMVEMVTPSKHDVLPHPMAARLIVLGLCVLGMTAAILHVRRHPRAQMPDTPPLLRGLGRGIFHSGNIWFGIALLVLLIAGIFVGGWWETHYGGKSARWVVYTGPWFGLGFLAFALSLISATLRKYPFRVDQAGWLTVHAALVIIIVGTFMSFWGKVEGEVALTEGQRESEVSLETQTKLQVEEVTRLADGRVRRAPFAETIASFDVNPANREPVQVFPVRDPQGKELFKVTVDRFHADGDFKDVADDGNPEPCFGVSGHLNEGEFHASETSGPLSMEGGMGFGLDVRRAPGDEALRALREGRDRQGQGRVLIKDRAGAVVASAPVKLKPRAADAGRRSAEPDFELEIPGTGIKAKGTMWFDHLQWSGTRAADASPGVPYNPAVVLLFTGPKGEERRGALAWDPAFWDRELGENIVYRDYTVVLDYFVVPARSVLILPDGASGATWMFQSSSEPAPRAGKVVVGQPLDLGLPMVQVTIDAVRQHQRNWQTFQFKGFQPQNQGIRIQVEGDVHDHGEERWLLLDRGAPQVVHVADNREFLVTWRKKTQPLGFELYLHDFHVDYYPGSQNAQTFESYLRLTHPEKAAAGMDVKIDMNHPLRLDGWRLYQSRFDPNTGKTTFLQVNRDPGLIIIYPACGLLVLGLVVVFFQKPYLKSLARWLDRRGASPEARFGAALGTVVLCFLGTLPGLLIITLLPDGPTKGIGVAVILAGLVLESLIVVKVLKPRVERTAPAPVPARPVLAEVGTRS